MPAAQQLELMGVAPGAAQDFVAGGSFDATGLLSGLGLTSADVQAYGGAVTGGDVSGGDVSGGDAYGTQAEEETPAWQKNLAVSATQKLVGMLGEMLGGGAQDQPQRAEGQTDAEYTQQLVAYAGIPPTDLAPDSQEYFDYIRAETDRMIKEVLGQDAEFLLEQSPEQLAQMLGDKRQEELQQLQRALFVRGQMGTLSSRTSAVNPFTGETEELEYAGRLAPTRAAYQRGLAGETEQLAGLRGQDARTFLESLTGRKADLFGMQARQDAGRLRAQLEEQDPDSWRRRRRPEAAAEAVQATDSDALDRMLAELGDEDAQMAALRELFGQA
jgi:hypothetical protein